MHAAKFITTKPFVLVSLFHAPRPLTSLLVAKHTEDAADDRQADDRADQVERHGHRDRQAGDQSWTIREQLRDVLPHRYR